MKDRKTLTFLLMDAPFENARTTTALRLIDIAARRGYDINVFAYEGAVYLPFAAQKQHANAVHGHDVMQEDHPLPREWVEAVVQEAARKRRSRRLGQLRALRRRARRGRFRGRRAPRQPGRFLEDGDIIRQHAGHRDEVRRCS
jgi:DsrE/DsrF-like family